MNNYLSAAFIDSFFDRSTRLACRLTHLSLIFAFLALIISLTYTGLAIIFSIEQIVPLVFYTLIMIWVVYNIIFNYVMATLVYPGNPSKLPLKKLQGISDQCKKCLGVKPPRTHHCSMCNECVMQMDHHCPWIGNCIGHYNRKYFISFLTYVCLGAIYYVYLVWVTANFRQFTLPCLFAFSISIALGMFGGFHWMLVLTGKTTLECCHRDPKYNPRSDCSYNFKLVYGNTNVCFALLPSNQILDVQTYEWEAQSIPQVQPNRQH